MTAKEEPNWQLVGELARLLRRYPKADWDGLIRWLENAESRDHAISALHAVTRLRDINAATKRRGEARNVARLLDDLRATDPLKADFLVRFRHGLLGRQVLPTAQELKAFADVVGLELDPSLRKREQAVSHLVEHLLSFTYEDIVKLVGDAPKLRHDLGREYERWVDLILRRAAPGG